MHHACRPSPPRWCHGGAVVALRPTGLAINWAAQLLEAEATMGCRVLSVQIVFLIQASLDPKTFHEKLQ
jgi:hypothetical protein